MVYDSNQILPKTEKLLWVPFYFFFFVCVFVCLVPEGTRDNLQCLNQ